MKLHICSYPICDLGPGQTKANGSELFTLHQSALVNFELVQIMGVFPHNQPTKEISAIQGGGSLKNVLNLYTTSRKRVLLISSVGKEFFLEQPILAIIRVVCRIRV